jgi:recombination protein RecR
MTESQNPFEALGGAGGFDMNALLQQAQQMQEQLAAAQERLHDTQVEGQVGSVTVKVSGVGELVAVDIKPDGFDASDPESFADLGDMVVAAYRDAKAKADALAADALGPLAGGLPGQPGGAGQLGFSGRPQVYEGVVQDLIDELGRLPGVGPKSAQRIAFHLLQAEEVDVRRLADVLVEVKARVKFCSICFNVSEDDQCRICRDPRRDQTVLCVVEEYKDVVAIERTREFKGRYHVLGGAISPIDGIGPDQLRVRELMIRLADGTVTELILATDPNLEGEATATYLTRMLKDLDLSVTRLASGLPVGGDLEYADEVTLGRALVGRRNAR